MLQPASSAKPFQVNKMKSLRKYLGVHVNKAGSTEKSTYQIESIISNRDCCLGTVCLGYVFRPGCQGFGGHENGVVENSPVIDACYLLAEWNTMRIQN